MSRIFAALSLVILAAACAPEKEHPQPIYGPDLLVTVQITEAQGKNHLEREGLAVVEMYLPIQDDGPPPFSRTLVGTGLEFPIEVELTGYRESMANAHRDRPQISATIYFNPDLELTNGDFITSLSGSVTSSTPPARAEVVVDEYIEIEYD